MKAVFASILALLLMAASFGAEVHAKGSDPLADLHVVTSGHGQGSLAECCDAAGHEMSGSCSVLAGLVPAVASAVPPETMERAVGPAMAAPLTAVEADASRKPPRTL